MYNNGKTSRVIFEEAGFDINVIGIRRVDCAGDRWRKSYKDNGALGLYDTRRSNSGRPRQCKFTKDEIIAKQNVEI
ncbi:MAG: IS3 family transposase, partial [Clostridium sp.]|nr:IS3 family transposase [Clostridium sp.]